MASLNTLRTKFGIVLSIVIAGALLAFILSLKTEMGFSGNAPRVGVIDGEKINYSEYYNQYEQVKAQSGAQESNEQQSAMLANAAWQALIGKYVLTPGFDKMGLRVTEPERMSMVSGQHPSQAFYNAFADPRTGEYNVAAVHQFLSEAEANAQAQQAWAQLNEQARMEREVAKFLGLIKGGVYVNSLEVANGVNSANNTYAGKWAGKKYSAVPDSLIQLKSSDIKAYYNSHKNMFKQTPSRALSYVVFEVSPTDDDMLALEKSVAEVGAQFAATEELKSFVRANRNGKIADNYVSAKQLSEEEAKALLDGATYGPVLKNNEWTMARALDTKIVPDSMGIRHIVLPYTQEALADSLLTVLKGGADFAQVAAQYSVYDATAANGGEVGVMPFSAFSGEFAAALANAKTGDIVKIASGDAIQLMQVYRADKPSKHVQVASITYPVEASAATRRDIHNQAGTFSVNAKGSVEAFNDAASAAAVTPRIASLAQGERTIRGLEDSRDVARWAYGAEVGDVSEIFPVGKDYVIAMLTEIDDNEFAPLEKVSAQIRAQVLRDKKYDYIVKELSGSTLDEQAKSLGTEVADFDNVTFGAFYVNGPGFEPRLIGAISSTTEKGVLSAPVKGLSGVYVFEVDDIQTSDKQTAEGEKVRAQAMAESMAQQFSVQAIQQMAKIQDLRGKYF
ncbi:peptidylprolyl isomerase [Alistipes finegoldii]|uniref:Periplasmic chaperone PpiD n=1 Tax=Alistipes finegoldii TaxID=214856 RepID=A0AA37P3G1_9BACT|nr:peptidylprolyl isomerase [Alistipes finegoldii]BDF63010.1 peptidylprolyl isomerase [Alistipes finegoldii]GKI17588.1 peptidylprolyl isomerase [Alistipes finegoldii]